MVRKGEETVVYTLEGMLNAQGLGFALVAARFNRTLADKLVEGALDCLQRHGAEQERIKVVWVPGAFELPQAAAKVVRREDVDAVICLGVIIRGGTPHFEYIAAETAKGIAQVALRSEKPVTFGVVTADTLEQALERCGTKQGNKGWDAAMAAIEMANLYRVITR